MEKNQEVVTSQLLGNPFNHVIELNLFVQVSQMYINLHQNPFTVWWLTVNEIKNLTLMD